MHWCSGRVKYLRAEVDLIELRIGSDEGGLRCEGGAGPIRAARLVCSGSKLQLRNAGVEVFGQRLSSCLSRLLPHLDRDSVALTGGVAIELHLAAAAKHGRRERIADIDFVASHLDVIAPTVASDFLVSHYHVAQRGVSKGMVQLVDPATRLRLDIFPDLVGTLSRAKHMLVAGEVLLVLDPRSVLEQNADNGPL